MTAYNFLSGYVSPREILIKFFWVVKFSQTSYAITRGLASGGYWVQDVSDITREEVKGCH